MCVCVCVCVFSWLALSIGSVDVIAKNYIFVHKHIV